MVEIIKSPSKYSPVDNPIVWGFSSSGTTKCIFEVTVLKPITYEVIYVGKIIPPPSTPNIGYINLSPILAPLVRHDVKEYQQPFYPKPNNYVDYILQIREYVFINGEWRYKDPVIDLDYGITIENTVTFFTPTNMAYQAKFDVIKYTEFGDNEYICDDFNFPGKFMTNKPDLEKVNFGSTISLYFMVDEPSTQLYQKFIDSGGDYIGESLQTYYTPCVQPSVEIVINDYIEVTGYSHSISLISKDSFYNSTPIFFGPVTGATVEQYVINLVNEVNSYVYNPGFSATTGSSNSIILTVCGDNGCNNVCVGPGLNGQFVSWLLPTTDIYVYDVLKNGTFDKENYYRMYQMWWDPGMWCEVPSDGHYIQPGETISIALSDVNGVEYSERKTFIWDDLTNCQTYINDCDSFLVNIHFTNSLGGVDVLQGMNPSVTYNVENKTYINNVFDITKTKHNEYRGKLELNTNSSPSGRDSERPFLKDKISYDKNTRATLTVYTKFLSEDESKWLMEMFRSESIWIEGDQYGGESNWGYASELIPLTLKINETEVKRKKYIKDQFIQYELVFDVPQNFINILSQIIRRYISNQD